MSKKLDDLINDFDELSEKAQKDADDAVGDKLSSLTRLTKEEINELFPKRSDQKRLAELMRIVRSADEHNKKVNAIVGRAEEFSGVVVKLLDRFV